LCTPPAVLRREGGNQVQSAVATNRPTEAPNAAARSRGLLVTDALESPSAAQAIERLKRENPGPDSYNPFNLLVVDSARCFLVTYDGGAFVRELGPGPHVVGNTDPFGARSGKLAKLDGEVERVAASEPGDVLDGLREVCASHGGNGDIFHDACVHAGAYGTRSSTILRVGETPADDVLWYADGAPCKTSYEDFTPLLHDLRHPTRYGAGATAMRSYS